MNDFKKSGGFRKSFGGDDRRSGGGGFKPRFNDDRLKQMFQTTCSECGKACEVPFRPTGERPVYCRDCFASKGGGAGSDFRDHRPRNDFSHKKSFGPRQNFRPKESGVGSGAADVQGLKKQIEILGAKLDRLIETIESQSRAKALGSVVKKVASKKKAAKKK